MIRSVKVQAKVNSTDQKKLSYHLFRSFHQANAKVNQRVLLSRKVNSSWPLSPRKTISQTKSQQIQEVETYHMTWLMSPKIHSLRCTPNTMERRRKILLNQNALILHNFCTRTQIMRTNNLKTTTKVHNKAFRINQTICHKPNYHQLANNGKHKTS